MSGSGLQDDLEMVDGDEDADDAASSGSDSTDAPQDPKDKRINDLMSKWQSAEARATAAEAKVAAPKDGDAGDDSAPASSEKPVADEGFAEILRDAARDALFASDPRLKRFGFKPDVIAGTTAAEMRESMAKQVAILDAVEGKVRNEVLAEHGLTNDAAGGGSEKPQNFAEMSSEDFLALVDRVKAGG